jgi:hypothetical protein
MLTWGRAAGTRTGGTVAMASGNWADSFGPSRRSGSVLPRQCAGEQDSFLRERCAYVYENKGLSWKE